MTVEPGVSAAAMSAFSVPITDGSSMKKSHAVQPAVGARRPDVAPVLDRGAQGAEGVEVRIEPAAADHVAARRRQQRLPEAGQQRAGDEERGADALGELGIDIRLGHGGGVEHDRVAVEALDLDAEVRQQLEHRLGVADLRHVVEHDPLVREKARGQERQGRILVAGGRDGAGQRHAAFDDELFHQGWERGSRRRGDPARKLG